MISKFFPLFFASIILSVASGMVLSLLLVTQRQAGVATFFWLPLSLGVFWLFLFFGLYGLYVSIYIKQYYYDASERFLTIQKGVFAPTEIHVPYQKIQDVYVDQDVLDRLMGLYDVHIASATVTSGIEAHIDGVDAKVAEGLKNFLLDKIQYGDSSPNPVSVRTEGSSPAATFQGPQAGVFSSVNYPIDGKWVLASLLGNLFGSAYITGLISVFLFGRDILSPALILPSLLGIFLVLYVLLFAYSLLWKATFSFELLPQFILMKDGVVMREEKHVPYRSVQNVLLKRTLAERIFGLCSVVIENAAMASSKVGRASRILIPGQPLAKGAELIEELNRILAQETQTRNTGL